MQAVTPVPQLVTTGREPSTPACGKPRAHCIDRTESAVGVQQVGVGQAGRAGHVAAAHAGTRFRRVAGEAALRRGHPARVRRRALRRLPITSPMPRSRSARKSGANAAGAAAGGRRLPSRGPRVAIWAGRRRAPPLDRGRTAASATSRAPRTPGPSGRRTPRASRWTRRARRSAWRTGRGRDHVRQVGVGVGDHVDVEVAGARNVGAGNSALPSWFSFGRYFVASNTTRSGLPSSAASQSVVTQRVHRVPPALRPAVQFRHWRRGVERWRLFGSVSW